MPDRLCECGCGEATPRRFRPGHHLRKGWRWTVASNGCWNWDNQVDSDGYGRGADYSTGRRTRAHILVYEAHVGPVPEGLQLDHLCRNKRCVNPTHLEPVTNRENTHRGAMAKLDADAVRFIRTSGHTITELAQRFGVSRKTVRLARQGVTWTNVEIERPSGGHRSAP
jgi:HNH endonuclease